MININSYKKLKRNIAYNNTENMKILNQCFAKLIKQVVDNKTAQDSTLSNIKQVVHSKAAGDSTLSNVKHAFYDNYEAIMHFIRYLRKRDIVVGSDPLGVKWNDTTERPPRDMYFNYAAPTKHHFLTFHIKDWWKHKKEEYAKVVMRSKYEDTIKLGPDIATAKLVIEFGGRIRFKNHNEWLDNTKKDEVAKLPKKFDENYILEEMDLRGYPLKYESLHLICNLYYLRTLILKGCKTIDDWSLDKISAEYPSLEYLDISECENVTERGVEALYRMPNLKKLTVTNHHGSAAFDLTCFLLEDVNPYLKCEIQQLKHKTLSDT